MDSRLKELSIESKNTQNGVLTKALCKLQAVKKIGNLQHLLQQQQQQSLFLIIFGYNLSLICINLCIWVDYRLKGLSIESKNTQNGVLTKELCKLQAVKKISNLQHLLQQQPLFLVIFRYNMSLSCINLYMGGF